GGVVAPFDLYVEDLFEPQTGQQFAASFAAMNHVQGALAEFLQAQRHARHCPHECRVHHDTFLQIEDEFAITSIHHLPREFLQAATIEEAASARYADPYDGPVDAYLNRGLHD